MITKTQLDESLEAVKALALAGDIDRDVFFKCIVGLSYDYLQISETQAGLRLISQIPESYFREVQLNQMIEDEAYRKVVILMSYKLIQLGVVETDEVTHKPTQPPAQA